MRYLTLLLYHPDTLGKYFLVIQLDKFKVELK
jgi:hypothetical protein